MMHTAPSIRHLICFLCTGLFVLFCPLKALDNIPEIQAVEMEEFWEEFTPSGYCASVESTCLSLSFMSVLVVGIVVANVIHENFYGHAFIAHAHS